MCVLSFEAVLDFMEEVVEEAFDSVVGFLLPFLSPVRVVQVRPNWCKGNHASIPHSTEHRGERPKFSSRLTFDLTVPELDMDGSKR